MRDLYDMLQLPCFTQTLGYNIMEVLLLHLMPELKPLFQTLAHGGLQQQQAAGPSA